MSKASDEKFEAFQFWAPTTRDKTSSNATEFCYFDSFWPQP
jgi:hypothetical protein